MCRVVSIVFLLLVPACKTAPTSSNPPTQPPAAATSSSVSSSAFLATTAPLITPQTVIPAEFPRTMQQGSSAQQIDLGTRGKGWFWPAIFLNGSVSKVPGPVFLHIEGLTGTPNSEVDAYLLDRTLQDVEAHLYIGSFTLAAKPPVQSVVVLEIKDVEHQGQLLRPRTMLREMAHFAMALVVKRGSVQVERIVLTTASESDRVRTSP